MMWADYAFAHLKVAVFLANFTLFFYCGRRYLLHEIRSMNCTLHYMLFNVSFNCELNTHQRIYNFVAYDNIMISPISSSNFSAANSISSKNIIFKSVRIYKGIIRFSIRTNL